jgi:hypothetical protein
LQQKDYLKNPNLIVPSLELVTTPILLPANISKPLTAVKREERPRDRKGRCPFWAVLVDGGVGGLEPVSSMV